MDLRDAIQIYHDLLTEDLAAASQAQLDDQLARRGLYFGQRPLCTVLRPRFLTEEQRRGIERRIRPILSAFARAYHAALADPAFREQFGLAEWEEALVQHDPGYPEPSPTSRLDAFFAPETGDLHVIEYNAEVPAATAYQDVLMEVFYGLPVMREFMRGYAVRPLPARHGVLHVLLSAFEAWAGRREAPRIAILDWREVPTYSEFVLLRDYFRAQGLECVIADPRELEYRDGRLIAGNVHVTLVYKRVLISELIDRGGLDQPVVRAVLDGAACMVNPFRCKLLHKKASLAVLSDERNADLFTPEERAAIAAHIPWTRRIEERHTVYRGQEVDLIPFVAEHRERFVLKPNDEYGGKGVLLGWQADQDEWERALAAALDAPHVVQEQVPLPREPYPSLVDGRVELIDRLVDTDPFVCYGEYMEGCLTRISTESLLNVTAGGGSTVPTFVVAER